MCRSVINLVLRVAVLALIPGAAWGATDPALIGWWTFDEGSGDVTVDVSPNHNDGHFFQGPPVWVAGVHGTAVELTKPTLIEIPAVNLTLSEATMAGWIKPYGRFELHPQHDRGFRRGLGQVRQTDREQQLGAASKQTGLSEVRFFYVPVKAYGPTPASGATGVPVDGVLNWRPARRAAEHEVHLSTDPNAVLRGKVPATTVTEHRFGLGSAGVEYDRTYYWKVNEVNEAQTPRSWEGDVWSFSTPGYSVVDDFESYNDKCNRIFFTWLDGSGHQGAVECGVVTFTGNGTGTTVGYRTAPYAEQRSPGSSAFREYPLYKGPSNRYIHRHGNGCPT